MNPFQTKISRIRATRYGDVMKESLLLFQRIKKQTKRRPYIRSAYFRRQKVFFDYFWPHLFQKNPKERVRRLQYFPAALEVIRNSRNTPNSFENQHKRDEIFHRFVGLTKDKELFYVQIKENKRTGRKYFMSCFPGAI